MGNIGEPKRVITVPEPIKAPAFPMPVTTPTPVEVESPELVPVRVR